MLREPFLKSITILGVILGILIYGVQAFATTIVLGNLIWVALVYYYLLSVFTFFIAKSGVNQSNHTFLTRTYSSIGIRMLFSLAPLMIYLLFMTSKEKAFIVGYLLLYLFFTGFEIYFLVVNLRPVSNKQ